MTCRIAAGYVITVEGTRGYPVAIRLQGVGAARFRRIATSSGVAVPVRRAAGALAFQGPGDERYTIAF